VFLESSQVFNQGKVVFLVYVSEIDRDWYWDVCDWLNLVIIIQKKITKTLGIGLTLGMAIRVWPTRPHKKKNVHLCILITSFMGSCINISNSCISGKDKYYVIFNVLKFKEYIMYVIVWIWWKCWIINLSYNSPKSLLNFV